MKARTADRFESSAAGERETFKKTASESQPIGQRPPGDVPSGLCLGSPLQPSPPAEKANACEEQAGKTSTSDGSGDSIDRIDRRRIIVSLESKYCSTQG